ncbi:MAG: hypothetical protein WC683_07160 [bacterium]
MANSDYSFYGGNPYSSFYQSMFSGGAGGYNGLSVGGSSNYLSSFGFQLPTSLGGFIGAYLPDVASQGFRPSSAMRQGYSDFLGSDAAGTTEGIQAYLKQLQTSPEIQDMGKRSEFSGYGTYLEGDEEGALSLSDFVAKAMGESGSAMAKAYGSLGVGADVATTDLEALLSGGTSAIGKAAGATTDAAREAIFAQLVGNNLIDLGDQTFNPFSSDILSDMYSLDLGNKGLSGQALASLAGGLLSTQNLDITGQLAGAFGRARETGADLGYKGKGLGNALADIAGGLTSRGQTVGQGGDLAMLIDQMFGGAKIKGSGGLYSYLTKKFA